MLLLEKIVTLILSFKKKKDFLVSALLEDQLKDCNRIIDLGCGQNSPIKRIKRTDIYTLGVDIFPKYIELSKKEKIHDDYLLMNILDIEKKIPHKSFDCVLLLDVIEHLTKLEGISLIRKVEKIAKKKVIILSPNKFLHQSEYHDNIYQRHKSGWDLKIFKKMQYKVYGVNSFKFIRGENASIRLRPLDFWKPISRISDLLVKFLPQFAFQLFCIKNLE